GRTLLKWRAFHARIGPCAKPNETCRVDVKMVSIRTHLFATSTALLLGSPVELQAAEAAKPQVLFIAVDDLNDWVGCLGGHPQASTPNIDRLAKRGTLFTKAYCVAPACHPSRTAIGTGKRPATTGVFLNEGFQNTPSVEALKATPG